MIETVNPTIDPIEHEAVKYDPFPASLLDRFMEAVQRLPIPYWLTYLGLFILENIIAHTLSWIDGWLPVFKLNPILILFPLWQWGPFALITYLNSVSREAISSFAPLLDIKKEELEQLKNEFTHMPGRSVFISGAIWSLVYFMFTYAGFRSFYLPNHIGTWLIGIFIVEGLASFSTGSIIYYHSIRQLRLINRIVRTVKGFNLFHLDPVYAFSLVTSRTGISWVILSSLTLLMFPVQIALVPIITMLVFQIGLAISAFMLPLQIVHHHLVLEKRRLLKEHHKRLESVLAQLHHSIDKKDLTEVMQLNNAISGLNAERDILTKIPTYPWRSGMLTNFLSISVLPIILFLIQFALGHWLGK